MTDVDATLRAHADAAASASLDPAAWGRLAAATESAPPGPERRRPRPVTLVAAAAVVALVAAAIVALGGRDNDDVRTAQGPDTASTSGPASSLPSTSAPTTSTSAPSTSTTTAPPPTPVGPMPTAAVALYAAEAGALADVVRLDGLGAGPAPGQVAEPAVTVLAASDPGEPDVSASQQGFAGIDAGPDGTTYVETCCEPAVGVVEAVTDDGTRRQVAYGQVPAIAASGDLLAVSDQTTGVRVVDPADGTTFRELGVPDTAGGVVTRLAWSPDGSTLAAEVTTYADGRPDGTYVTVHAGVGAPDAGADEPGWVPLDGALGMPAFLADGRLAVGTGTSFVDGALVATGLAVVDPVTGAAGVPWYGGAQVRSFDATADGTWLVATSVGGALRAFRGDDLGDAGTIGQLPGDLWAVAW